MLRTKKTEFEENLGKLIKQISAANQRHEKFSAFGLDLPERIICLINSFSHNAAQLAARNYLFRGGIRTKRLQHSKLTRRYFRLEKYLRVEIF